jgi:hypothetical protein
LDLIFDHVLFKIYLLLVEDNFNLMSPHLT